MDQEVSRRGTIRAKARIVNRTADRKKGTKCSLGSWSHKCKTESSVSYWKFSKETGIAREREYPESRNAARWKRRRTNGNSLPEEIRKGFERRIGSYSCKGL